MVTAIDLNSDLGESFGAWTMGDDTAILQLVSSANVACGFHAGSPAGLLSTLRMAKQQGVAIGAHVSYPDLVGFGRRNMDVSSDELTADVIYQIGALQGLARAAGTEVRYVKPHGALYNTIAHDERQALAVINAIQSIDAGLPLVGLAGSRVLELAQEKGLRTIAEAFADRAYHTDGSLVSRREAGSVLHDAQHIAERMLQLITLGGVTSIEGEFTPVKADSICVHGDSPGAIEMARQIRNLLEEKGIAIRAFVGA
ncbi:lactam utilization protein [Buttiauxella brennerae ATCC 51605]|uniref:5-oxoprolinase subunit A n=1 Tax=Buttiauxella brennerae ATCC 51605 TaxID=1354251 RepID=A0A1B7IM12_9ENTR|nr:5-oxoprolinase subunit PxpA [Buttiauxella brennerae]OAT30611.1 lactam utilization protein [Buttiauxella brennerae ATCC 51605]